MRGSKTRNNFKYPWIWLLTINTWSTSSFESRERRICEKSARKYLTEVRIKVLALSAFFKWAEARWSIFIEIFFLDFSATGKYFCEQSENLFPRNFMNDSWIDIYYHFLSRYFTKRQSQSRWAKLFKGVWNCLQTKMKLSGNRTMIHDICCFISCWGFVNA